MGERETLDSNGKVIGQSRGAKAYKRWVPKEWRPEYEAITALSCTGLSNEEVGRRFGYGKQQISNILNTPQAKALREIIVNRLREKNTETLSQRMDNLNIAALERIEAVITSDTIFERSPLAIFDRSMKVLEKTGAVKGDSSNTGNTINGNVIGKAMIMTTEAANILSEGLRKANEVKVIHSGHTTHGNARLREFNGLEAAKGKTEGG